MNGDLGAVSTSLENFNVTANDFFTINTAGVEVFANNISIAADSMALDAAGTEQLKGSGALILKPRQISTTIGLAGGAGDFNLDASELANIADGFASITIGSSTQTGNITANAHTFTDPLSIIQDTSGEVLHLLDIFKTVEVASALHPVLLESAWVIV